MLKNLEHDLKTAFKQLHPKATPPLEEGLLKLACREHPGETPESLLSFKLYSDRLAVVLSDGRKFEYTLPDLLKKLQQLINRDTPEKTTGPGDPPRQT